MLVLAVAYGVAALVGSHIDLTRTYVDAPPFYGFWRARFGWTALAPVAVALAVVWGSRRRHEVAWPWVLLAAVVAAVAWSAALGVADHSARLTYQIHGPADYARGLDAIGSHPGHYLATFNTRARGPGGAVIARGYPVHVQGHPPGAVLTLWALTQVGLTAISGGIALVWSGLVATVVGVLLSVRRLAGEAAARAAAPFVVLLPAAVWSHTYDSFFAGVGALAVLATVCALVPGRAGGDAAGRARVDRATFAWALLGGVLFGYLALLSYGLVVLAAVPALVALQRRRFRPLVVAGVAAAATLALPFAWGFNWFGGLATTHHQYVHSVASSRPYGYFVWADLVIAVVALGPATLAGWWLARRGRSASPLGWWHSAAPLVLGASLALLVAAVTGLAKAEVERIFQPFFAWIALAGIALAAPAAAARRDRVEPVALSLQAALAIVLATLLSSPW